MVVGRGKESFVGVVGTKAFFPGSPAKVPRPFLTLQRSPRNK